MIKERTLSGFVNEIKIYIVTDPGYLSIEDIVQLMIDKEMIMLPDYSVDQVNCTRIVKDINEYLYRYSDDTVLAYFLKYMFGYKNDDIYGQKLYYPSYISCTDVDIRNVDRIFLNIRRRVFVQPRYTKPTFRYISDIVCNEKGHALIKDTGTSSMTVEEFIMFHFECSIDDKPITLGKLNTIRSMISEIEGSDTYKFTDTDVFPWNALKIYSQKYEKLMGYLSANGLVFNDIINNIDIAKSVVKYNITRMINNNSRSQVVTSVLVDGNAVSNVKIGRTNEPDTDISTTRLHQLYHSGLNILYSDRFRFIFDGFELFVRRPEPDKVATKILDGDIDAESKELMNNIIQSASKLTLQELVAAIYNNPLLHNVIIHGYQKGLMISNQELRRFSGVDKYPELPEKVEDMKLSTRARCALMRRGIIKTKDMVSVTYDDIRNMKNIGKKTADEIVNALNYYGISMRGVR